MFELLRNKASLVFNMYEKYPSKTNKNKTDIQIVGIQIASSKKDTRNAALHTHLNLAKIHLFPTRTGLPTQYGNIQRWRKISGGKGS